MRWSVVLLLVAALAGDAVARPNVYQMTCSQAAALVAANGAIVMNTGPNTYTRFVTNAGYCVLGERAWRAWAATADTPQCRLGYECRPGQMRNLFD